MDRVARGFFGIAVLVSLIQTLHAISTDEYHEKTTAIKSKPEIVQFLNDNRDVISQYGVFFDKIADIFNHVRKTKTGNDTMDHVWDETETILKEKRTFDFIKSILEGAKRVLTSEVGRANLFVVANFIQDELRIPKLFKMCLSLKKIILNILLSEHALDALRMIKENNFILETDPATAKLLNILNNDFPILTLPSDTNEAEAVNEEQTKQNVSQMKSLLSRMKSVNRQ